MTNTTSTRSMIRRGASVLVIGSALIAATLAGSSSAQAHGFGGGGFHGGGMGGHGFGGHGFGGHGFGHGGWGHGHGWGRGGFGLALGVSGDDSYGTRVCGWQRQFDDYGNYLGNARVCRWVAY